MYWEMVKVVLAGPPSVMFLTSSKSCNVPMVEVMVVNKIIGFNCGTMILKNFWKKISGSQEDISAERNSTEQLWRLRFVH